MVQQCYVGSRTRVGMSVRVRVRVRLGLECGYAAVRGSSQNSAGDARGFAKCSTMAHDRVGCDTEAVDEQRRMVGTLILASLTYQTQQDLLGLGLW